MDRLPAFVVQESHVGKADGMKFWASYAGSSLITAPSSNRLQMFSKGTGKPPTGAAAVELLHGNAGAQWMQLDKQTQAMGGIVASSGIGNTVSVVISAFQCA
jgi:hypothetical protein